MEPSTTDYLNLTLEQLINHEEKVIKILAEAILRELRELETKQKEEEAQDERDKPA